MKLDRHDRKLLARLTDEGPQFLFGNAERRAVDLYVAGLASRKWCLYRYRPPQKEYRWRYAVTDAGRAVAGDNENG